MGRDGPRVVEFTAEAVRKRPGLYVGDTARYGAYHLGYFALDLMLSASVKAPTTFEARLEPDGSLSLSADCEPREPNTIVQLLDAGAYHGPPELLETNRWWELLTISALSDEFSLEWAGGNGRGTWTGRKGKKIDGANQAGASAPLTKIRFKVDAELFSICRFDFDHIAGRVRELAALHPGLRVRAHEPATGREMVASFPKGLVNLVSELSGIGTEFAEPIWFERTWGTIQIQGALQWTFGTEVGSIVVSFANDVRTRGGGKHVLGLLQGIEQVGRPGLWSPQEGLVAAVAVTAPRRELVFKGPTKDVLATEGLDVAVREAVVSAVAAARAAKP